MTKSNQPQSAAIESVDDAVRMLGSASAGTRRRAVGSLARLGGPQAGAALFRCLFDTDKSVIRSAARELKSMGIDYMDRLEAMVGFSRARKLPAEDRNDLLDALPERIASRLKRESDGVQERILFAETARTLGVVGDRTVLGALGSHLGDTGRRYSDNLERCAMEAMRAIARREADKIAEMLPTMEGYDAQAALTALGLSGDARAINRLAARLAEGGGRSEVAFRILLRTGDAAVPALAWLLHHPDYAIKLKAAEALASAGTPLAVEILTAALEDWDRNVRLAAGRTMVSGFWETVEALVRAGNPGAVEAVLDEIEVEGYRTGACVRLLSETDKPRLLAILAADLQHEDEYARLSAVKALGEIEDTIAIDMLVPMLDDESVEVSGFAESSLRTLYRRFPE